MRVVIAEDLVLLRTGLTRMLREVGIDVVAEVGDARSLVSVVSAKRPDLAIIDIRMPPTFSDEGAQATRLLRERYPALAIVVLSHIVDPGIAGALTRGRWDRFGYLLKERVVDVKDFLAAVRRVAAGGTAIDPDVIDSYLASNQHRLDVLTSRELEVLRHLAAGRSNGGIAAALVVSERTVDAHLRSIFTKLDLPSSPTQNRRVQAALAWLSSQPTPVLKRIEPHQPETGFAGPTT